MTIRPHSVMPTPRASWGLPLLALALAAGATGCFRATGVTRGDVMVAEIPATGGDRVQGLKATAGPGDFYLGNDSVHLAVDGAAYGDRQGQFGAPSGGAILDVGTISLDQSYHRVAMPTDLVERLGQVVNQDPDLPLVFDRYLPTGTSDSVKLEMQGGVLDPQGKLGAARDANGRLTGVSVTSTITLNKTDGFFTLETTVRNTGGSALAIRNVGDHLSQRGGGYRFVVPAVSTFTGASLNTWGVEIPGSDFTAPLTSSVVAPMVGLMGAESGASTSDYHASLGIMPLDGDTLLVASDPQQALTEARPRYPARLVVGSMAAANLPAGQSISYRRRLYAVGGVSYGPLLPAQATTVFNLMAAAKGGLQNYDLGSVAYLSDGTALSSGPLQTEFKVERYTYTGTTAFNLSDPTNPANQAANWRLERVEWREPTDLTAASGSIGMLLPVVPNSATGLAQRYRLWARNATMQSTPLYVGTNLAADTNANKVPAPITPSKAKAWSLLEPLSPERDLVVDGSGVTTRSLMTSHGFSTRQSGTLETGGLNPLRITFQGVGVADPHIQRIRRVSTYYSEVLKGKAMGGSNYGIYQYSAGNQIFGTAFGPAVAVAPMYFYPGSYLAYGTRGPLSYLDVLPVKAFEGQTDVSHPFIVTAPTFPAGWTSFDVPGPTQATTGGFNPGELLSSALAEGVQVVTRTEEDLLTDPSALQAEFRAEIDTPLVTDAQRVPVAKDPFVVGGRSSSLSDGYVTALFVPAPTTDRNGGARPSAGWNLADFITQAEGSFTVIHRPRGATGLFTVRGFNPVVALGTGANAWWTQTGTSSLGKRLGDFDGLELIRGEGLDGSNPDAWYTEYGQVRDDWYAILKQQTPTAFTKALGLSSARYSLDTPVGLARTYLNVGSSTTLGQSALGPVLLALKGGAAVASTGPLLNVSVGAVGPGGLVAGPATSVSLKIDLYAPDWVPVDEVRVVVNGGTPIPVLLSAFTASSTDFRLRTATVNVPMPSGKDAFVVVEAGVSRNQTGVYRAGTAWNKVMKGIYPIAVTNPIFVDVTGGGYTPPGL